MPDHPIGGPGYHDPTAGIGGAPPARSALTARLVVGTIGLVLCVTAVVLFAILGVPDVAVGIAAAGAAAYLIDLVVVARRKLSGEPG